MVMLTMSRLAKVVLDRSQEITAHRVGLERTIIRNADPMDASNFGQKYSNWHELVWQEAEGAGAEIAVAFSAASVANTDAVVSAPAVELSLAQKEITFREKQEK